MPDIPGTILNVVLVIVNNVFVPLTLANVVTTGAVKSLYVQFVKTTCEEILEVLPTIKPFVILPVTEHLSI